MSALQGVNLGSWLVLERWMIPEVFADVSAKDEHGLVAELGYEQAAERMAAHRETFITEGDFAAMKRQGFDFVRLPVGFWLFQETDGWVSGENYVKQAFAWAEKHKLGVILDIHGLPGSQNGKMHSGQLDQIKFYEPDNQRQSLELVEYLASTYGPEPSLIGLQLINEPHIRVCPRRLLQYYDSAYKVAEKSLKADTKIIVSDAFWPNRMSWELARRDYGDQLVLDIHMYQVFGKQFQSMSFEDHMSYMEGHWNPILSRVAKRIPILVGEWSGALPGSAHAGVSKQTQYIKSQQDLLKEHVWAQAYWSYKKSGSGAWSAQDMIQKNALKPYR